MMKVIKPYEKYKDSGVAWLGEVPESWEVRKAKKIFNERSEKGFESEPFLAATQNQGVVLKTMLNTKTVLVTKDFHTLKLVEKGDFVISLRSFQGGIEYSYYRGIISPAYTILKPQSLAERGYFKYYFKSKEFINCLTLLVTGIREGQNIDTAKFKDTFLPLPPKNDQAAISNFLDYKTAKIDRFIAKKKQLIKLLNEQKAGIINDAVTKGLNPNAKTKPSGIEWLGDIPEHWEVRKLKYLVSLNDETLSEKTNPHYKLRYIDIGNVDKSGNIAEIINYKFKDAPSRAKRVVKEGDIIISTVRTYLTAITQITSDCENLIVSTGFAVLRTQRDIDSNFLNFAVRANYFIKKVCAESFGVSYPAINASDLINFKISFPSIAEQKTIVSHIEAETAIINKTIATIEKEIALTKEYRIALIAEAVTGKIDVRDYEIGDIEAEEFLEELEIMPDDFEGLEDFEEQDEN
ncbi:MAG: type I restriction enzyme S subunit [Rickettsiales bacterium]|jgi:type I restriction enzyme S subunit